MLDASFNFIIVYCQCYLIISYTIYANHLNFGVI